MKFNSLIEHDAKHPETQLEEKLNANDKTNKLAVIKAKIRKSKSEEIVANKNNVRSNFRSLNPATQHLKMEE